MRSETTTMQRVEREQESPKNLCCFMERGEYQKKRNLITVFKAGQGLERLNREKLLMRHDGGTEEGMHTK